MDVPSGKELLFFEMDSAVRAATAIFLSSSDLDFAFFAAFHSA
jgi:hypothetical protein